VHRRHHAAILLVAFGAVTSSYTAWALHRASDAVLVRDMSWPRPAPYPDAWIAVLNRRYDALYPAPPDHLKIHGESPRVRLTIGAALALGLFSLAMGVRMGPTSRRRAPESGAGRGTAAGPPRGPAGFGGPASRRTEDRG
jgi:hypothetical protein